MSYAAPLNKPEFDREHRLGLVVYGGIALAIYMNGICQEFYNAVRGRGIYKLIKILTNADIVVDIISGTSAGGINGVLLSYALANSEGTEKIKFEEFAKVWKESGDINKLFVPPENPKKDSFFDGDGYYRSEIQKALESSDLKEKKSKYDWFSEFRELDLFITGTDLLGRIDRSFDATGCLIETKDHRTVFHLQHRPNYNKTKKPFRKSNSAALAKLCQITSCFPVAFSPVTVNLKAKDEKDPDTKLVEWGRLDNRILSKIDYQKNPLNFYFVDGGVLDNRPFSHTIQEIYHRAADRPVFRKLFYIDPCPDRFKDNPDYVSNAKPDVFQVVQKSLISMPRYESITKDLEQINEHNERVRRYRFLLADLENILDTEETDIENKDYYDRQRDVYRRTRIVSLENRILPLILAPKGLVEQEENKHKNIQRMAKLLEEPLTSSLDIYERKHRLNYVEESIRYLDVDYTLRRFFFISEYVYRLLDPVYLEEWLHNKKKQEIDSAAMRGDEPIVNNLETEQRQHEKELDCLQQDIKQLYQDLEQVQPKPNLRLKQDLEQLQHDLKRLQSKPSPKTKFTEQESQTILQNLKSLIKGLNGRIKLIRAIKEQLDELFISLKADEYIKPLSIPELDASRDQKEKFAREFYQGVLYLHWDLLNVESLSTLDWMDIDKKDEFSQAIAWLKSNETNKLRFADFPYEELIEIVKQKSQVLENKLQSHLELFLSQSRTYELSESELKKSLLYKLVEETKKIFSLLETSSKQKTREIEHLNYIKTKLGRYFKEFEKLDTVLYPLDYFAGIPEKQVIETFRISPEDTKLGLSKHFKDGERLDKKLAGDSLNAFGGFFKKSWRANDILWGRLDGLNRLVEALITPDKINANFKKFVAHEVEKYNADPQNSENQITSEEYLNRLFDEVLFLNEKLEESGDRKYLIEKKQELKEQVKKIFWKTSKDDRDPILESKDVEDLVKLVVEIGHLIILDREFQNIMEISLDEQLNGKQRKGSREESKKTNQKSDKAQGSTGKQQNSSDEQPSKNWLPVLRFNAENWGFNSAITATIAKRMTDESLGCMALKRKEEIFKESYKIGSETLEDIPKPELKKLILKSLLIFQDIFTEWQCQRRERVKEKNLHKTKNPFGFWNQFVFLLLTYMVNIAIWIIRKILLLPF